MKPLTFISHHNKFTQSLTIVIKPHKHGNENIGTFQQNN